MSSEVPPITSHPFEPYYWEPERCGYLYDGHVMCGYNRDEHTHPLPDKETSVRFDQCGIDCTTDCGHCKGHPVDAMRDEIARLRTQIRAVLDAQEERDRRVWRAACGFP